MAGIPERRTVIALERERVADATGVLARAFHDDPVAMFMYRRDRARPKGLSAFFRVLLTKHYGPYGAVDVVEDGGAVAIWGPPERKPDGLAELVNLLPAARHMLGPNVPRAIRYLLAVEKVHPKEPHWYLATIGVDPASQGKGYGSALLESRLAAIDETGMPAYLESSKERNVPLYARHGFEVTEEYRPDPKAPPMWLMWRSAR